MENRFPSHCVLQGRLTLFLLGALLVTVLLAGCRMGEPEPPHETAPEPVTVSLDETLVSVGGEEEPTVSVDFGTAEGLPIFRKISGFTSGWIEKNLILGSVAPLSEMRADNFRMDCLTSGSGIWDTYGSASYTVLFSLFKNLQKEDILPYLCMMPLPNALKPVGSTTNNTAPSSQEGYYEYCYDVASNIRKKNLVHPIYEVWNEPDLPFFFDKEYSEYVAMYQTASRAIRDADPDATVGGLSAGDLESLIRDRDGVRMFLDAVVENDLPLDFVSYHCYNEVSGWGQDPLKYTAKLRKILNEYDLPGVRMQMTEYNITQSADAKQYSAPAKALNNLLLLNDLTEVELVHWANIIDPGDKTGLISPDFEPYPLYHTIKFWQTMPITRRTIHNSSDVKAIASSDSHRGALILWNDSRTAQMSTVTFSGLPFRYGNVTVYAVNADHALKESGSSTFYVAYQATGLDLLDLKLTFSLNDGDSFYVALSDDTGIDETAVTKAIGQYVREDVRYPDRGQSCYADYERRGQILLMGSGDTDNASAAASVVYDNVCDVITVLTSFESKSDALAGACGMQIAYHTADGYTKSVCYPIAGTAPLSFPFVDTTENAEPLPESLTISLKEEAPAGFDGRIRVSFLIEGMPAWSAAQVQLRAAE